MAGDDHVERTADGRAGCRHEDGLLDALLDGGRGGRGRGGVVLSRGIRGGCRGCGRGGGRGSLRARRNGAGGEPIEGVGVHGGVRRRRDGRGHGGSARGRHGADVRRGRRHDRLGRRGPGLAVGLLLHGAPSTSLCMWLQYKRRSRPSSRTTHRGNGGADGGDGALAGINVSCAPRPAVAARRPPGQQKATSPPLASPSSPLASRFDP